MKTSLCQATAFAVAMCAVELLAWTVGMDDDAGKAAATSSADLPAADFTGMRHIYPKRDRLFTTSLDGTWAFKLVNELATPDELKGWNEPGYDTREWNDYRFPGNRSNVKWAAFGENGEVGMIVLESGTGNVSFENISGRIYLTENMAVAGYEGGMTMKHIAMLFALIGKQ